MKDTLRQKENDGSHGSFFKYWEAIWLSENSSDIKETLIEVYFNFFTVKSCFCSDKSFIRHCLMSGGCFDPWKIILLKEIYQF